MIRDLIRTAWVYAWIVVATLYWGLKAIVVSRWNPCDVDERCSEIGRNWSAFMLRRSGADVGVEGIEHLEEAAPRILVSNHESWYDVWALAAEIPGRVHFVAKKELEEIPVFGAAWTGCGHISIDRQDRSSAIRSLDRAGEKIRDEPATVVIFPEGTRSRTGELQRFKKGAFVLALKAGVPVVPAGIAGSRRILPKGGWRIRGGEIRVRVGEPLATDALDLGDRDALLAEAHERVRELRSEARADLEEGRGGRG